MGQPEAPKELIVYKVLSKVDLTTLPKVWFEVRNKK